MLYHVTIGDRTVEVEIGDGVVKVDGVEASASELVALQNSGVYHLLSGGKSHAMVASTAGAGMWEMHLGGRRVHAEVVDERTRAIRAMTRASSGPVGPKPVKAPMPGLVVRVEVAVGDTVRAGQGVLIMEAMKMENELRADAPGVVSRIHAESGQAVEKGTVLVEFTPVSSS